MTDRTRMPALYIGHGAPPLLDDPVWSGQLAAWARDLPRPKAILIVSAHWESAPVSLSATATGTPLVYDFGGFAPKYYNMQYVTPDASAFAARVAAMLRATDPRPPSRHRGLDHGAWVPLVVMFPAGDIPVLQISLPTDDPVRLMEIGRKLASAARRGRPDRRVGVPDARAAVPSSEFRTGGGRAGDGPTEFDAVGGGGAGAMGDVDELGVVPHQGALRRTRPWSTTHHCSSRSAQPPTRRPPATS